MTRYSETVLEKGDRRLRLLNAEGHLLLELEGPEIEDAIHGGFLNPESLHYSMFEYWRIRLEVRTQIGQGEADSGSAVDRFLDSLDIRRLDDDERRAA